MILVFGTICLDRVRVIPHFPKPGGFVEVVDEKVLLGGEAANTANALKTWGAPVRLEGNWLGSSPEGDRLRRLAREKGFDLKLDRGEAQTPICDVFITPDGDRTMVGIGFSASDNLLDVREISYQLGAWFTVEPNMATTSRQSALMAAERGMKLYHMDFYLDDEEIPFGSCCQTGTDWVGERGNEEVNLKWVADWSDRYGCTTILTDGPEGFFLGRHEVPPRHFAPFPADTVVDSTGAGDLFRAGMLFGLDQDWPLSACLKFAAAAGCLSCRSIGATEDVPTIAEINALIAANPNIAESYEERAP
jgi:sugar/nucleoside kinase (ribokinase family)